MVNSSQISDKFFEAMPIFRDITSGQLAAARQILHAENVEAHHALLTENQPGEIVYIIVQGSAKVCARDEEGNTTVIALRGAGEVVGEMSVLDGQGRSASVVTLEPTLVLWIDRADFWSVLWEMPPIPYNLTHLLTQRLRTLTAQVQAMASLDVQGRLARQLIALAQDFGQPESPQSTTLIIPFFLNQAELASMIGTTREQVNKLLKTWERRGISLCGDSQIALYKPQVLEGFYKPSVAATLRQRAKNSAQNRSSTT